MDTSKRDTNCDRKPELTTRQRRFFLAYWAAVGAVAGALGEVAIAWGSAGVSSTEPAKVVARSLGMAVAIPAGLWLSWRFSRPSE